MERQKLEMRNGFNAIAALASVTALTCCHYGKAAVALHDNANIHSTTTSENISTELGKYEFVDGPTIDLVNRKFEHAQDTAPLQICSTIEGLCFQSKGIAFALPKTCPEFETKTHWSINSVQSFAVATATQEPWSTAHMPLSAHHVLVGSAQSEYLFLLSAFGGEDEYHLMGLFNQATFDDTSEWWKHGMSDYPIRPRSDHLALCTT